MTYFVAYNQYNPLCIGKLFKSVDEAVETATITILNYIDDTANDTRYIFGENIESYFENRIGDKYQFNVYQIEENDAVTYIRTVDLWQIARMSRESMITKGMIGIANDAINTKLVDASKLSDYYFRIITNIDQLQRITCSGRAGDIIIDTYTSIIQLGFLKMSKYEVLKYE